MLILSYSRPICSGSLTFPASKRLFIKRWDFTFPIALKRTIRGFVLWNYPKSGVRISAFRTLFRACLRIICYSYHEGIFYRHYWNMPCLYIRNIRLKPGRSKFAPDQPSSTYISKMFQFFIWAYFRRIIFCVDILELSPKMKSSLLRRQYRAADLLIIYNPPINNIGVIS